MMEKVELKMCDFGYFNADCMTAMREFPDGYFDIAVCDPPYGLNAELVKDRGTYAKQRNGSKIFVSSETYDVQDWDKEPPSPEYFRELFRISRNQIIWGCNYFDYPLPGGRIVWDKCNDGSDQSGAEIAYCSFNKRVDVIRYMWRGMMQGKSIVDGTVQQGNKALNEKRITPTQKPVAVYKAILGRYTQRGMKMIDTHVGSASSLIAAHDCGLRYVGFEICPDIYEKSKRRLDNHTSQMSIYDLMEGAIC